MPIIEFGSFRLDPDAKILFRRAEPTHLGPRAVGVLRLLVEKAGSPVSKDALIKAAWEGLAVEDSNLTVQIASIRKVLGEELGGERWIETLSRRGYRYIGPATMSREHSSSDKNPVSRSVDTPNVPPLDKPSIAVLPFANISGDGGQDYFVDGMTEEIITALSKWPSFLVIARNSTFAYKGRPIDSRSVGQELGVRYLLEGSVRKSGARLRINGQLIEAETRAQLWADRFEGSVDEVFELQDKVTEQVVGTIAPKVELAEIFQSKSKKTENLAAYDYYLRGLEKFNAGTDEANIEAIAQFETSVGLDSRFAQGYAMAALCYGVRRASGWKLDPKDIERAIELANKSIEIDPFDAQTLGAAGFVLIHLAGQFERGSLLTAEAVRLNPNMARAWLWLGFVKMWVGEHATAKDCYERSIRLNPFEPYGYLAQTGVAWNLFLLGRPQEAWPWVQRAMRTGPKFLAIREIEILCLIKFGRLEEAREKFRMLSEFDPAMKNAAVYRQRSRFQQQADVNRLVEALQLVGLPE